MEAKVRAGHRWAGADGGQPEESGVTVVNGVTGDSNVTAGSGVTVDSNMTVSPSSVPQ